MSLLAASEEPALINRSALNARKGDNILLKNGGMWQAGIPDSEIDWVANDGARVSKVHAQSEAFL